MKIARTLLFAALGILAFAPPSTALLHVCTTETLPGPCAAEEFSPSSNLVIQLYIARSNGVNVTIDVSASDWIKGFNPDPSAIVEYHPNSFDSTTKRIHIAGVRENPTDPPPELFPSDAFRLGSLIVDASSGFSAWVVAEAGSKGVVAEDAVEDINPGVIPEPAQWLMLTAGSTVLAALSRRRSRLAKHRV
jgi:hypothetical protein